MFGKTVYNVRKALGRQLAKDTYVDADMVIPIPDSGIGAAIGYSQETGIPFEFRVVLQTFWSRKLVFQPPGKILVGLLRIEVSLGLP